MKDRRALFCPRTASSPRAVRRCKSWLRSCGKEDGVNDVIYGIEPNHGCDSSDDARSSGGANSGRPPFHGEAPITGDPANKQTKQETFQDTGNDVTNEKSVTNEVEKIDEGDAKISAGDETTCADRCQIRNGGETRHKKEKCEHAGRDQKPQWPN